MLFAVTKLKEAEGRESNGAGILDDADNVCGRKLAEVVNLVDHGRNVHWVSEGDWSMHQLLQSLLEKTGPADVWISSYAFSELPARTVCELKATGVIKQLRCVIDSRVDVRSASALAMLRNACDGLALIATHAKVTLIKNNEWFVAVVGSANYTTNKRYEAGLITTDAGVCNFHQTWIKHGLRSPNP